jgi:hypothetical protein
MVTGGGNLVDLREGSGENRGGGVRSSWSFKEADDVLFILLPCLFLSCYRYSDLRIFGPSGLVVQSRHNLDLLK